MNHAMVLPQPVLLSFDEISHIQGALQGVISSDRDYHTAQEIAEVRRLERRFMAMFLRHARKVYEPHVIKEAVQVHRAQMVKYV